MSSIEVGSLHRFFIRYGVAIFAVAGALLLRLIIERYFGRGLPTYITFYPAVMLSAVVGGFWLGLVATAISILITIYWILTPIGQFAVASRLDVVGLALFLIMGVFMSGVAELYRRNGQKAAAYDKEVALRESQEAIRRHREWLRVTLDSIGDAVITTDTQGKITFINPVAVTLTGWPPEEAAGREVESVFPIINEKTRAPAENIPQRVLREGCVLKLANNTALITRDGREIPIEDSAAPIKDSAGKVSGVVLVFHDVTQKRRAQDALRKSHVELELRVQERTAKLQESESRLRSLASELINAQETERKRIAHELHDSLAAQLAAIKYRVEQRFNHAEPAENPKTLQETIQDIQSAITETRRIMANLRPSVLDDLGIVPALSWLSRETEKSFPGTSVQFTGSVQEQQVPDALKIVLFRVVQESVANAVHHGKSSLIRIGLERNGDWLWLGIEDNGNGFVSADKKEPSTGGMGLVSMQQRVESTGGVFSIRSNLGEGTMVKAEWRLS